MSVIRNNIETILLAENICYNLKSRKYVFHVNPADRSIIDDFLGISWSIDITT